jgi:regulatory protein YycI of two-component signal transduction system YycFG
MIFLIITVFIAQLILLINIVCWIIAFDRKVSNFTEEVVKTNLKLECRIKKIREITEGINEIFPYVMKKLKRKRNNLIIRALNEFGQTSILLFFKPKYKKILVGLKLGLAVAKDLSKR